MSLAKKRGVIQQVQQALQVPERRACRAAEQPRSPQRLEPRIKSDEERLREAVIALALEYRWYGHRQMTRLLRLGDWRVNHKRIERIWASRRVESAQETAQTETSVDERWFLYQAAS